MWIRRRRAEMNPQTWMDLTRPIFFAPVFGVGGSVPRERRFQTRVCVRRMLDVTRSAGLARQHVKMGGTRVGPRKLDARAWVPKSADRRTRGSPPTRVPGQRIDRLATGMDAAAPAGTAKKPCTMSMHVLPFGPFARPVLITHPLRSHDILSSTHVQEQECRSSRS